MAFTRFETSADIDREQVAAQRFADFVYCELSRAPPLCSYDFSLWDGSGLIGLLEVKCRTSHYDTMILSFRKYQDIIRLSEYLGGVDAFLLVRYENGLYYCRLDDVDPEPRMAGREPRPGAVNDIELVIDIPKELFIEVT